LEPDENQQYQARVRRMRCYKQHNSFRRAIKDCLILLKIEPDNLELLKEATELANTLSDPESALEPMEAFVQSSMEKSYSEYSALSWELASLYIELLAQARKFDAAVATLKRISRWILGREEETYWDDVEDDREWDIQNTRRLKVSNYQVDRFDEELYGLGLPIEFRVRLATLRIQWKPGDITEAIRHLDLLCPEEQTDFSTIEDFVELFLDAADTLRQCNHHAEALRFYEPLRVIGETLDSGFFFSLAICYQALDRPDDVRIAIEGIKHGDRSAGGQLGLAKLYQTQGKIDMMWRVCAQLKRAGKIDLLRQNGLPTNRPAEVSVAPDKPFAPRKDADRADQVPRRGHILKAEEEQQEKLRDQVIRAIWDDLQPLEGPLFDPDDKNTHEWFSVANELYLDFRSCIEFFPRGRVPFTGYGRYKFSDTFDPNVSYRENKMSYTVPTTYRHISFDDWTDFLMCYALKLAGSGDRKKYLEILDNVGKANIVNCEPPRYQMLRTTALRKS
jgi:general transcription factor 3C polypeptide 3 (transcription factor C subunit 4)